MSEQHCQNYDVKQQAVHCYPRNVDHCCTRSERAVEGGLMSQRVFQKLPLFCFGLFCYTNHLMTRNQSLSVNYSICYPVIISLELK